MFVIFLYDTGLIVTQLFLLKKNKKTKLCGCVFALDCINKYIFQLTQ